jgi:hypothetical protein
MGSQSSSAAFNPATGYSSNLTIHTGANAVWVSEPRTRGTMSLLISCVTTIFLCTWTVLHLDVPESDAERTWKALFLERLTWMVTGVIVPEFVAMIAVYEYIQARQVRQKLSSMGKGAWSLTQTYFLNMNGVVYQSVSNVGTKSINHWNPEFQRWGASSQGNAEQMSEAIKPESLPTDVQIMDRSKTDPISKSLALVQAAWFVTQVTGRTIQGLPLTALELGTCGLIACAGISYSFWWYKPQDVQTPVDIGRRERLSTHRDGTRYGGHIEGFEGLANSPAFTAFAIASLIVGAMHCIAWNFAFPTLVERFLWRMASVLVTVLPLVETLFIFCIDQINTLPWFLEGLLALSFSILVPGAYIIVRLFLIVEMFVSLRRVPVEVYHQLSWVNFIPHL